MLPSCCKIFERLLYNSLFNVLAQNILISPVQLGFKPGDSCINHLLSVTLNSQILSGTLINANRRHSRLLYRALKVH